MAQLTQQATSITMPEVHEVVAFLVHEARLLDERRFEEWMALFGENGIYWAPASVDQQSPLSEVSIFYDDHALMNQRITRLRHDRIHIQSPPSRTVHIVDNPAIKECDSLNGHLIVFSKFLMVEYRPSVPEGMQRIFAGDYRHTLKKSGTSFEIVEKKATLVNCDAAFAPMALYF